MKGLIPMEIENGRGHIISGSLPVGAGTAGKKENKTETRVAPKTVKAGARKIKASLSGLKRISPRGLFRELGKVARSRSRRFAAAIAGTTVCALGLGVLGTYCTVGIDYYYGGKLLCTVAAADDSAAIIGAAARRADLLGVDEPEIEVSAKLALKKDVVNGDEAVDAILAASPELCRGYTVTLDGEPLFTAADRETADAALEGYVAKYAMGGDAKLSGEVAIEEQIVRRDELTDAEAAESILENGGLLTVITTVDETDGETLPFDTTEVKDETMYVGDTLVETPGADGAAVTTVESIYSNGQLLSTAILGTETTLEPVTQVVRVGTKPRNALEDGFSCPVGNYQLTSGFGPRWGRQHRGIDMAVPLGTNVSAAAAGTVITAEYNESYGNYVQIDHGYGIVTTYAHLSSIAVETGQTVDRGQLIAYSGSTGNSTGPHLHFEVIDNGSYLNPLEHLV